MKTKSQRKKILSHLEKGKTITPLEALHKFGCLRLGARIYELRKEGYEIDSKPYKTKSGKYVSMYWLKEKPFRGKRTDNNEWI